jgi:hypothetical protein
LENKPRGEERFHIIMDDLEYVDNMKIAIKERLYWKNINEWHQKQPSRSEFDRTKPEKMSRPAKKMTFANFWNKIYTGTIWCNKRKKMMKLSNTKKCLICKKREIDAVDSHKHALGGCQFTKEKGDNLWDKMKLKWKEIGADFITIKPWFSTKNNGSESYSINRKNCDRGLIPREIFKQIKKRNPKVNIKILKKVTISMMKYHIIETFLERKKLEKTEIIENEIVKVDVDKNIPKQRQQKIDSFLE